MDRLLIAVLSCQAYSQRRERCLATWIPTARELGIDVVFVVGSPANAHAVRDDDLLLVPAGDDYASLPQKVSELCRWLLAETHCDCLFKCDDDTYVRPERLLAVDVGGADYIGAEWAPGAGYASGGAGYLLSRRAIQVVADRMMQATAEPHPPGAEDLLVGRCLQCAGIRPIIDRRFVPYGNEQLRPRPDNDLITAHATQWPWLAHRVDFQGQIPIVTCRPSGGLGNILFEVAAAVAFAARHGTHRAVFAPECVGRFKETILHKLTLGDAPAEALPVGDADDFSFRPIPHDPRISVAVCGYMQSEKYFADCRETIRELFQLPDAERQYLEERYGALLGPDTVSLHVRRGDYVGKQEYHPLQPVDYYENAIRHIEGRQPVSRILCFSDDLPWCRTHLAFDSRILFIEGEPDYLDQALMSMCRHHVISNSSFAWWGAWLCPHTDKIVVAPRRWLGPAFTGWTDRDLVPEAWIRMDENSTEDAPIHPHGFWCTRRRLPDHAFDAALCDALTNGFRELAETVVDFGCGTGDYIREFRKAGIVCEGYDGNPFTADLSSGAASQADLARCIDLGKTFDWVLSLEVGEHIPAEFEQTFIENLHRHNRQGIILSWAVPGQGGNGHFNERSNKYIRHRFRELGYEVDSARERALREAAGVCSWLKNTIMVFRRPNALTGASGYRRLGEAPQYPHAITKREIRRLVRRDDPVILELGCHDGSDSIEFLREFPGITMHCFEPDRRPLARFRERISDPRCTLHEFAIGALDGEVAFHLSGGNPPDGRMADWDLSSSLRRPTGHLAAHPWCTFDRTTKVATRSLDSWLAERPEIAVVDFLWADIQGAEGDLIAGGAAALQERTRYLYTEFYEQPMYDGQIAGQEILDRLPAFECLGVYEGYNMLLRNVELSTEY